MKDQLADMSVSTSPQASFPVRPEQFWQVFAQHFKTAWLDPSRQLSESYNHAKPWTRFMTGLLMDLAPHFGCHVATEYMRIDVAYFDKPAADWEEWAMEVAVEIENDMYWIDEISKLLMINAGLKVLIAYDDPGTISKVLNKF